MKQISIYLDPTSYRGKRTIAHAQGNNVKIHPINFTKNPMTETQLLKCINETGVEPHELVEAGKHSDIDFPLKGADGEDWVKLLVANPHLLKYPIALKDKCYHVIKSPQDISKI